jgi:soluble lytic murein transglycosylase-like protein
MWEPFSELRLVCRACVLRGLVAIAIFVVAIATLVSCTPETPVTPKVDSKPVQTSAQAEAPDLAPPAARKYRRTITSAAQSVWGLGAPVPVFGAQVHQESAWNEQARSPVGAQGLAQFMPATADWIDDVYPDLGPHQPYNPTWALTALVRYDKHLWDRTEGSTECDRMAFALSGYNGGAGWVTKDKAAAARSGDDPRRYWGSVEKYNAGRKQEFFNENRGYPPRILKTLQPKYETWGRTIPCPK